MTVAAIVFFAIALVAELAGIVLVVIEGRDAAVALRELEKSNPEGFSMGTFGTQALFYPVIKGLLGNRRRRWLAVALLIIGVVAGAAGNFLSLNRGG